MNAFNTPDLDAPLTEWLKWVDEHFPYRSKTHDGPHELRDLVLREDRELAAISAQFWFRLQAKHNGDRKPSRPPEQVQIGFDGEDWDR